jgi:hypothetical protein
MKNICNISAKNTFRVLQVKKGIGQLAKITDLITSKKWLGENREFSKVKRIYPVLVVHDRLLGVQVYGEFFATEFLKLLEPDSNPQFGGCLKGDLWIALPIIITIDDLEILETSIEHFAFRDLLSDYSRACPERLEPLRNFIAFSDYKKHMYHNRNISSAVLDIIEKSKNAIFPDA